ncbi:tyrosine-type recombinase/integrase [Shewanella sp. 0m-4]
MADNKHLVQRGNIWWFVRRVPQNLKHIYPDCSRIQESLNTSDIRVARAKRDVLIGEMQKLSLSSMSSQRSMFKHHMKELKAIKMQDEKQYNRFLSTLNQQELAQEQEIPANAPVWDRVLSPDYIGKEDDKAYVEAFKAVTSGRDHSPEFSITLLEAVDEYCSDRKGQVTPTTLTKTKRSAELLLSFLGKKDLLADSLERRQAYDWLRHLETSYSSNTVFAHLSHMRSVYKWLINRGDMIGNNVFEGQTINANGSHQKYQLFEYAELRQLNELIELQSAEVNLHFKLGLHTGARLSELGGLELTQVILDTDIPYLLIKTGKQKTGVTPKYRSVPVADNVLELLRAQYDIALTSGSQYLFCDTISNDRQDGRAAQGIGAKFSRVKKRVTDKRTKAFHSLRVHAATWCQAQNIPEHITSTLLGHSNGQTMSYAYYAKQNPDLRPYKEAIELLAASVSEAID